MPSSEVREPAVAGQFYPGTQRALAALIERLPRTDQAERQPALGVIMPHAGYDFSGACARRVVSSVTLPRHVLILATDHFGVGPALALWNGGAWRTPLGACPTAHALVGHLDASLAEVVPGTEPHGAMFRRGGRRVAEHSAEVQIPLLQDEAQRQGVELAIAVATVGGGTLPALYHAHPAPWSAIERLGRRLGEALADFKEPVLVVASSDMSHEEAGPDAVRRRDAPALDRLAAFDPEGLYEVLVRDRISMCGGIPALLMLVAARARGATRASIVTYATSADTLPAPGRAVGYAGVRVC